MMGVAMAMAMGVAAKKEGDGDGDGRPWLELKVVKRLPLVLGGQLDEHRLIHRG